MLSSKHQHHHHHGPGYSNPMDAFKNASKEKYLYVTCVKANENCPDYLATIDVDNDSETYGQIINRCYMTNIGDELHHSGWNSCSSCYNDCSKKRNKLILPCLRSNRIYIIDVNGSETKVFKVIDTNDMQKFNVSAPHTSHCLPTGEVMISCMGDNDGHNQGSFLLLNSDFEPYKCWNLETVPFGYDFWYQPRLNILISTEWTSPNNFRPGFFTGNVTDSNWIDNNYGHCLHLWEFKTGKLIKSIDLRSNGKADACMPLEVRFLHSPESPIGFVGCAFSSNVFRFVYNADDEDDPLKIEEVIRLKPKKVNGFIGGEYMPALITDILISMDDKYLFISAWLFGEIRQYSNLTGSELKLVSRIRIGGLLVINPSIKTIEDDEPIDNYHEEVNGKKISGGPQMIQLSLDGKRLYATNSLYSAWDKEFYPDMHEHGSQLVKININDEQMELDPNFIVDFGDEPNGPSLAHEIRYPGGDCTSDIWI